MTLPIFALFALVATTAADLTRSEVATSSATGGIEVASAGRPFDSSPAGLHAAITAAPAALQLASIRASGEVARIDSPAPQPFSFGKQAVRATVSADILASPTRVLPGSTHDGVLVHAGSLSSFGTSLPPPLQV